MTTMVCPAVMTLKYRQGGWDCCIFISVSVVGGNPVCGFRNTQGVQTQWSGWHGRHSMSAPQSTGVVGGTPKAGNKLSAWLHFSGEESCTHEHVITFIQPCLAYMVQQGAVLWMEVEMETKLFTELQLTDADADWVLIA